MVELRLLVNNRCRFKVDDFGLEKKIEFALSKRKIEGKIEISLLICGPKFAQKLNQQYRKMNYIPQVLGFPMSKEVDADGWFRLGDIVVCYQKLKKEARMMNKTEDQIWEEWLEHGIENLLIH